ncbi:hypothetical protein BaRGS_00006925, partial [Batillaria attramentaria]
LGIGDLCPCGGNQRDDVPCEPLRFRLGLMGQTGVVWACTIVKYFTSSNFTHDTKCRKCGNNEFVDKSDPAHPVCHACTTCSPDTVEMKPCAADADTECVSNVTTSLSVTVINFTTTSSSHSGEPSGDEGLGGGGIAGIVLAILTVIIFVVVIVCVVRRKQRRGSQPPPASHDESDEEQETRARFISHSPDAPNASTANGAVTMSSLLSSPADELIEWNENYIS